MLKKTDIFRKFLFDHKDLGSGKSFMSFYNDFEQS